MASDYAIGMICHVSSKANAAGSIQHWKWSMPRGWSVEEHDCDYASSDNWQLEERRTRKKSKQWASRQFGYFISSNTSACQSTENMDCGDGKTAQVIWGATTLQLHRLIPPSWEPFQLIYASIHKSHHHWSKSKSSNKTVNIENGLK